MTKILSCNCKHDYQDKTYGEGKRVHNSLKATATGIIKWKCTVCNDEKTLIK